MVKTKIILYEDNQVFRESLERLINGNPEYQVVAAFANCNTIADDMRRHQPDVTLMDIQMPGINGLKGLEIIRSQSMDVKVIMLTVFEDNNNILDAICKGANGYLLKQASPSQIFKAIDEVLKGGSPLTPSIASSVLGLLSNKKVAGENRYQLTTREKEILESLVDGNSYKMIAASLSISVETVKTHIKNVYEKLHVNSQTEAVTKALKEGIV